MTQASQVVGMVCVGWEDPAACDTDVKKNKGEKQNPCCKL